MLKNRLGFALCAVLIWASAGFAQQPFFQGKTIRIIVGLQAGGGYDTYARLIARHMGTYIPGSPEIVVNNMTGAGSLISANYIYNMAKPDGLTIGHFIGGLFLQQLLGRPGLEFDATKFEYVGVPVQDHFAIGISKTAGIATVEQWFASKTPVKFGGAAVGAGTDDIPLVLKAALGLPIQLVSGYRGTADIRLAFNSGEIQAVSNAWQSTKVTWSDELESGLLQMVLQMSFRSHTDLTRVPLAMGFAKTREARKLLEVIIRVHGASVRPFVLPPGTSKESVQLLQKAFVETMRDPALLAEAKKTKLEINPLSGKELSKSVAEIFKLEPALIAKLRDILK